MKREVYIGLCVVIQFICLYVCEDYQPLQYINPNDDAELYWEECDSFYFTMCYQEYTNNMARSGCNVTNICVGYDWYYDCMKTLTAKCQGKAQGFDTELALTKLWTREAYNCPEGHLDWTIIDDQVAFVMNITESTTGATVAPTTSA